MTSSSWQLPVQVQVISVLTEVLVGWTVEIICIIHVLRRSKKHVLKVHCSLVMVFFCICMHMTFSLQGNKVVFVVVVVIIIIIIATIISLILN
jgi:hypothetical protein